MKSTADILRSHYSHIRGRLAKQLRRQSMIKHGKLCCQRCLHEFSYGQGPQYQRCELHHVRQIKNHGRYGSDLECLKRLLNQAGNLVMLCHLCHREFHDLYEDRQGLGDLESFELFMQQPPSQDYVKGYLLRMERKRQRRQVREQKQAERLSPIVSVLLRG